MFEIITDFVCRPSHTQIQRHNRPGSHMTHPSFLLNDKNTTTTTAGKRLKSLGVAPFKSKSPTVLKTQVWFDDFVNMSVVNMSILFCGGIKQS